MLTAEDLRSTEKYKKENIMESHHTEMLQIFSIVFLITFSLCLLMLLKLNNINKAFLN